MRVVGRAVYLRRVKERDAHIHGSGNQLAHLLLVGGRAVTLTHPHAAKPDRRNDEISKFAVVHDASLHFHHHTPSPSLWSSKKNRDTTLYRDSF